MIAAAEPHPGEISRRWRIALLAAILLLAAFLRLYNLQQEGFGNLYYAAAVKSMLTGWRAFFFVSFDPAGFVSVDKPPLGLWIQAASAWLLGFQGWSLMLPQALAGVLSVALVYHLTARSFGAFAGLSAALILALTPVAVATDRNNTMDSLLLPVCLLAAWAGLKAAESGRLRWLLLCAALLGIGFNIKMLQAFLVLPAAFAPYLFAAAPRWPRRLLNLALTGLLLAGISLAWVAAVDLTPADQRPYVGSSENNTVMELIAGHNGAKRLGVMAGLLGLPAPGQGPQYPPDGGQPGLQPGAQPQLGQGAPRPGMQPSTGPEAQNPPAGGQPRLQPGAQPQPGQGAPRPGMQPPTRPGAQYPPAGGQPGMRPGAQPQPGMPGQQPRQPDPGSQRPQYPRPGGLPPGGTNIPAGPGVGETGPTGPLRLYNPQLAGQTTWLLALALFGLLAAALGHPSRQQRYALLLWALWLLPQVVFFSFAGLFHRHYLIMPAPAVAALSGAGLAVMLAAVQAVQGGTAGQRQRWLAWLLPVALLVTAGLEIMIQSNARGWAPWVIPTLTVITGISAVGMALLLLFQPQASHKPEQQHRWNLLASLLTALGLFGLLAAPAVWAATPLLYGGNANLPHAGPDLKWLPQRSSLPDVSQAASYLLEQRQGETYILAALNAQAAAPYILATGEPVMALGGFGGSDPILELQDLEALVKSGQVRFFLLPPQARPGRPGAGGAPQQPGANQPPQGGPPGPPNPQQAQSTLAAWVQANCRPVQIPGADTRQAPAAGGPPLVGPPLVGPPLGGVQFWDCKIFNAP